MYASKSEMAKAAMSLGGIQMMMAMEDQSRRTKIVIIGLCWGAIATIFAGFYWARVDSVMIAQSMAEKRGSIDVVAYDVGCFNGPFSDMDAAADY